MKKHYWLSTVELTFMVAAAVEGEEPTVSITRVNTMSATDNQTVSMKDLAKVQQGAQMTLMNKLQEQVPILDLTVLNVSYLGHMEEAEFDNGAIKVMAPPANLN